MKITISREGLSKKQIQFLEATEDFALFGGARGGGKSHVGRIGATEDSWQYPGRSVAFVRGTIKQAREQFGVSKMSEIIPRQIVDDESGETIELWKFNAADSVYTFANGSDPLNPFDGGSRLVLAGITTLQDAQDSYQGIEFVSVWWDELTKAQWEAIQYFIGSLRDTTYKVKFRASSNPGEKSHKQVKAEYVDPYYKLKNKYPDKYPEDYSGKISWRKTVYDEKTDTSVATTYAYIPATLDDNPIKNIRDQYLKMLMSLPEHLRKMYRYGSWDTYEGKYWDEINMHNVVKTPTELKHELGIDLEHELSTMKTYMSMDWGFHDKTAIYWHLETSKGVIVTYKELYVSKLLMEEVAIQVQEINDAMGIKPTAIYTPWDIYVSKGTQFKTQSGVVIGEEMIDIWRFYNQTPDMKASNDRKAGWANMTAALKGTTEYTTYDDGKPRAIKANKWIIMGLDCPNLIEQINSAQINPKDTGDILTGRVDHSIDSCRYFWVAHIIDPEIIENITLPPEGTGARIRYNMAKLNANITDEDVQDSIFDTSY